MNPKCPEAIDEKPFEGMCIQDTSVLERLVGRSLCPKCCKSRKYFCYTCCVPVNELEGRIPAIKLPIKIDIIKHKSEIDGKSTAIHGAILASQDITIYTYPDIPDYTSEEKIFLVYPSRQSVDISSLFNNNCENDQTISKNDEDVSKQEQGTLLTKRSLGNVLRKRNSKTIASEDLPIKKAVFIDSTWSQSRGIYKDIRLKSLPCVVIQNRISQFWRHQNGTPRWYLATIEAVHQFLLEVHLNAWGVSSHYTGPYCEEYQDHENGSEHSDAYRGQYDNILFFFSHMYKKIHSLYEHESLRAYKRPTS